MTLRFVVQITEQRKLCVLSLHLSWTQFGCDNDAACLPLKRPYNNKSKPHFWMQSILFCQVWMTRCCRAALAPVVIFQVFLQLSRYSLDGLELGPLDLFSQTHRGFYFTVQANSVAQLFWQSASRVSLLMDHLHYPMLVKLTRKIKVRMYRTYLKQPSNKATLMNRRLNPKVWNREKYDSSNTY